MGALFFQQYSKLGLDPDAVAFFTATGITDATIKSAVNQLCVDLKAYSLWTKINALYPFVGGSATTHKYNLKDQRDLDIAFRLSFYGGWTHSATGAKPNGINAYANTFYKPQTHASINGFAFGDYSRTNDISGDQLYGVWQVGGSWAQHNYSLASLFIGVASGIITYTANPSTRLAMSIRTSNNFNQSYRDGISLGISTYLLTQLVNHNFYFGARSRAGSPDGFSKHELAFAFLGNGSFNSADVSNLTNIVNAFQTTLGRNV